MIEYLDENRSAFRFEVKEKLEAGLVLTGEEVKAVKDRQAKLEGAIIRLLSGQAVVTGLHIGRYRKSGSGRFLEEDRARKLLLKKDEIKRLTGLLSQKGMTAVPLKLYIRNNFIKVEIGVGRLLKKWQKKDKLIERQTARDVIRILKEEGKG